MRRTPCSSPHRRRRSVLAWVGFTVAVGGFVSPVRGVEPRSAMDFDPYFEPREIVHVLPEGTLNLWATALRSEQIDLQRDACAAVTRAHRLGIAVGGDTIAAVAEVMARENCDPVVVRAAARAIVAVDARELAPQLFAHLDPSRRDLARIIEPALARWKFPGMAPRWRERLGDPGTGLQRQILAIRGLAAVEEIEAAGPLGELVRRSRERFRIRYEAANALARIDAEQVVSLGLELAEGDPVERRLAAAVLAGRSEADAIECLVGLANDEDPAVAAPAMRRLLLVRPKSCLAAARRMRVAGNAGLRDLAIDIFVANPAEDSVAELVAMLGDVHSGVRRRAGDALVVLASTSDLRPDVERAIEQTLAADNQPAAVVEAALVCGAIGNPGAAPRLIELARETESDVAVATAWALGELALPETADAIRTEIRREVERTEAIVRQLAPIYASQDEPDVELPSLERTYRKVEHLLLAVGRTGDVDDEALLTRHIAKPVPQVRGEPPQLDTIRQPRLRAAAIWALGKIYSRAGATRAPREDVVAALLARMTDTTPIPAEAPEVRSQSAICLARMNQRHLLPRFHEFFDPDAQSHEPGRACGWAIESLTGTVPARNPTRRVTLVDWFLVPLD